jgi:hypothetical protein
MKEIRLHQPETKATQIILKKKKECTRLGALSPSDGRGVKL